MLFHAGITSRFSATGVVTVLNHDDNRLVVVVSQDAGAGEAPSTLIIHGQMFEQPLPPINHIVVLGGNVLSVRWAEAYVAIENLTVL